MIVILDSNAGNAVAIFNYYLSVGIKTKISSKRRDIELASHIVMPGVGSFDGFMRYLHHNNLIELSNKVI